MHAYQGCTCSSTRSQVSYASAATDDAHNGSQEDGLRGSGFVGSPSSSTVRNSDPPCVCAPAKGLMTTVAQLSLPVPGEAVGARAPRSARDRGGGSMVKMGVGRGKGERWPTMGLQPGCGYQALHANPVWCTISGLPGERTGSGTSERALPWGDVPGSGLLSSCASIRSTLRALVKLGMLILHIRGLLASATSSGSMSELAHELLSVGTGARAEG